MSTQPSNPPEELNTPPAPLEGSLRFTTTPAKNADPDARPGARTPFYLDDDAEVYWAVRPKKAKLLSFVRNAELLNIGDDGASMEDAARAMAVYDDFINSILDPESRERIEARLNDDDDADFDLDQLDPIIHGLVEHWFARPIGKPRGLPDSRRTTTKRSTGRARSTAQTRKR